MSYGFGINNSAPTKTATPSKPSGNYGFGIQASNQPTPSSKVATLPDELGGGAYNTVPGQPNKLVNTGHTNYAGEPTEKGKQRDDIVPVGLGGVNSNAKNLRYEPMANKQGTATDPIEKQAINDYKAGKISLPQARLQVLSAKQKQTDEAKGINTNPWSLTNIVGGIKKTAGDINNSFENLVTGGIKTLQDPIGAVKNIVQNAPQTSSSIQALKENPLSLPKENGIKNVVKSTVSDIKKPVTESWKSAVNAGADFINSFNSKQSTSQKVGAGMKAVTGAANVALSPISAVFAGANHVAILGTIGKLMTLPFAVAGDVGSKAAEEAVKSLPISQQAKNNIMEGAQQIGSLATQILLGGKISDATIGKLTEQFGVKDANTIIEKANQRAEAEKTTQKVSDIKAVVKPKLNEAIDLKKGVNQHDSSITYKTGQDLGKTAEGEKTLSKVMYNADTKKSQITIDKSVKNPSLVKDVIDHSHDKIVDLRTAPNQAHAVEDITHKSMVLDGANDLQAKIEQAPKNINEIKPETKANDFVKQQDIKNKATTIDNSIIHFNKSNEYLNIPKDFTPEQKAKLMDEVSNIKFNGDNTIHLSNKSYAEKGLKELSLNDAISKHPELKGTLDNIGYKVKPEVKPTDALIEEAKKYKSAEEFVKAQPTYYHGTSADFTTFDKAKSVPGHGDNGAFGNGLYFTDKPEYAQKYADYSANKVGGNGVVKDVSLSIKKPFIIDKNTDINTIKKLAEVNADYSTLHNPKSPGDTALNYIIDNPQKFTDNLKAQGYDGVVATLNHGKGDFKEVVVFDKSQVQTKSQLNDIWNKAHETPEVKPEASLNPKTSGVAKSIEAKSIEQGFINKGYDNLAQYDSKTFKGQAQMVSDLMKNDMDRAHRIVSGQEELPKGMGSAPLLSAMEDYAKETKDTVLMEKLANSPLNSNISQGASETSLARMRSKDSASAKLDEMKKAKIDKAGGDKVVQRAKKIAKTEGTKILLSKEELNWNHFLEKIKC